MPDLPAVLIVDDDPDIREMLAFVLERNQLRVTEAASGEAALAAAHRTPELSLVLLDLRMPGLSGAEVLAELKQDPGLAALPVIVLSGDQDATRTARQLGAEGCLTKPISVTALLLEVGRFLPLPGRGGPAPEVTHRV